MQRSLAVAAFAALLLQTPALAQTREQSKCASDDVGLVLPPGFCAMVFTDSLQGARHMWVAPNGDVYLAAQGNRNGGVWLLRDENGDGRADRKVQLAKGFSSSEVTMFDGYVYSENLTGVVRFPYRAGSLEPAARLDTIVEGLPKGGHQNKTFAIASDGSLYVNIGSPSNSCQESDRAKGSPGKEPCAELETRAGIWRWDARKLHQSYANSVHFARGIRNAVGIAINPMDGKLWSMQHGRDNLGGPMQGNWSFDAKYNAENPAEELLEINRGDDFGWPYCYYSIEEHHLVQAPEYGGDGKKTGPCASKKEPVAVYPGHWAPNGLLFYTGSGFPARYKRGAFIAFHGSWNRAPEPAGGFKVVFQPLDGEKSGGSYEVFADGFSALTGGRTGNHRPTGLAQGPDGALYVADDAGGRIYKIVYTGK